ncbi:MAG: bifunctional precorrin-2 dehydrogenase/sirohydrochlorin ferrochelatase [Thermoanaerobacteraceae bacterium]|nr:bifunctional precorrin-2 dehydrogenase/sirohydrochlorin ferrochelatase [Thermoanaerobacteraceae bacterium]
MDYYPVMMNIKDKKCLVVGGGNVALRKISSLLKCGAKVTVISQAFKKDIYMLYNEGKIDVIERCYFDDDVKGYNIVIVATDDRKTNKRVASDCQKYNIPVNVVDDKELSTFIVPSVVAKGDITISISTNGKSPLLTRMIREKLEKQFTEEYELLLKELEKMRNRLKESDLAEEDKIKTYRKIIDKSGLFQ